MNTSEEAPWEKGGGGNYNNPCCTQGGGAQGGAESQALLGQGTGVGHSKNLQPLHKHRPPLQVPHPHHSQDKGAIEGLRQGRMPRGCMIQIKGKETQPSLPPGSLREGSQGSW